MDLPFFWVKRLREGGIILAFGVGVFVLLSLITYQLQDPDIANAGGWAGMYLAHGCYWSFGYAAYLLPPSIVYITWLILKEDVVFIKPHPIMLWIRGLGLIFFIISGCGLLTLECHSVVRSVIQNPGGAVGQFVVLALSHIFNVQGAALFLCTLFLIGVPWLTGISWVNILEQTGYYTLLLLKATRKILQTIPRSKAVEIKNSSPKVRRPKLAPVLIQTERSIEKTIYPKNSIKPITSFKTQPTGELPALELLDKGQPGKPMGGYSHQELELLSREVEQNLLDFGIQADVVSVHPGPVITRFELQLAAGVKASKLTALSKDLARSLSVTSVRVVEIIPGKTVVGIELPNQDRNTVRLSDVLSSDVYQNAHSPLTLALGVDIAGHPMVVDLGKMPHLLVAGTTGSGKSVGINAMILSLLFQAGPDEVRLIMVDPKMLELSVYDGIPHLLTPVVTDMKEAASALRWCVEEMERRYQLMATMGVRNLAGFNAKVRESTASSDLEPLPYVVVIIDELADMMMVVGKKVEQLIARIAQKARAAGIHLILATQRPSVDVLTGLIKSNIPTRISFQVSSKIDSRTILDQQGAEQLLGHGDMLFLSPGAGTPLRVHGAFVDDKEVHRVADDWRARGTPEYIEAITQNTGDGFDNGIIDGSVDVENADPLYDQAVEFVVQTRKTSISAIQRRFKVGYNRAARLVEEMERVGILGPLDGGVRDVLLAAPIED